MNYQGELIVRDLINRSLNDLNVSMPAVVVGTDNLTDGFIDVKPVVNYMNPLTRETVEYPVIYDVPVILPSTSKSTISFPISQGDYVTLLFQSTYIKNLSLGNTDTQDPPYPNISDLSQAVAFVGFNPYQDSALNPNNYSGDFDKDSLNIVHNKNTPLEASFGISVDGGIAQKSPTKTTVDSPIFDVKANALNANNAIITTGGDVVVRGQSLNKFMTEFPSIAKGDIGDRGWSPVLATEERSPVETVVKIIDWTGGEGEKPTLTGYLGNEGIVKDIYDATNIKGASGTDGKEVNRGALEEIVGEHVNAGNIIGILDGLIDESLLSKEFQTKIDQIEVVKSEVDKEVKARVEDIGTIFDEIRKESSQRVEDIREASKKTGELQSFADNLANDVDSVIVKQTKTDEGVAKIVKRQETFEIDQGLQAERLDYLSSEIDFEYADKDKYANINKGTVWTFAKAVAHADYNNAQLITGLSSDYKNSSARFTEEIDLLTKADEAIARRTSNLSAQLVGGYDGGNLTELTSGLLFEEAKVRATEVEGLAEQISLLSAGVGEQFDTFEIWHFNDGKEGWNSASYNGSGWLIVTDNKITSPSITGLDGVAYKHVKLRIQKFGNPVWKGELGYKYKKEGSTSFVSATPISIKEPPFDEDGIALVNWFTEWEGEISEISLHLASTGDETNHFAIDWIAIGRPSPGASNAALLRESKVRATETQANAKALERLDVQLNGKEGDSQTIESSIVKQLDVTADLASTTASDFTTYMSEYVYGDESTGYVGKIEQMRQTLAEETLGVAESLDKLSVELTLEFADKTQYANKNKAEQWTYAKSVAADNYANSQRVTLLQSEFQNSQAEFLNEINTLSKADVAISSELSQISAKTNLNEALIKSLDIAITTPESGLASKYEGLQAKVEAAEILLTNKGEIIFSYGTPPTKKEDTNNVWFKLKDIMLEGGGKETTQTPHQWNGTEWVELKGGDAVEAKMLADLAKKSADSKGEIIYSPTEPTGDKKKPQNLWIDTSEGKNVYKSYNGGEWVVATDQTAVDLANTKGEAIYSKDRPKVDQQLPQNVWYKIEGEVVTPHVWHNGDWVVLTDKLAYLASVEVKKAKEDLKDIADDNKLTPSEKNQVKTIWLEIQETDLEIRANATKYEVSDVTYDLAYRYLDRYISGLISRDMMNITSQIDRDEFNLLFEDLYRERANLSKEITSRAEFLTSEAQKTANNKGENIYSSTTPSVDKQLPQNIWYKIDGNTVTAHAWSNGKWNAILDTVADKALKTANGKGEVLYSSTAPSADKQNPQNVWYKIDGESVTAHVWSNGKWTPLVDRLATEANRAVLDISDDKKLTPVEKQQVSLIIEDIKKTDTDIVARADQYQVSHTEYGLAYDALLKYINPLLLNKNVTSDIVRKDFNNNFANMYNERAKLDIAIGLAVKAVADEAQRTANFKGEVITSNTKPSADKQLRQNLWIDTTGGKNVYKRWNGSAWVSVTDQTAVELAKGKGEVIYSPTAPSVDKQLPQNVWYKQEKVDGKDVVTPHVWSGGKWTPLSDKNTIEISNSILSKVSFKYADKTEFADKGYTIEWGVATEVAYNQILADKTVAKLEETRRFAEASQKEINDILSDNKVTPPEKQQVKTIWSEVEETDEEIRANASKYNLPIDSYIESFTNLKNIISPILSNMDATSNVDRDELNIRFSSYYRSRAIVNQNIATSIDDKSQEALDELDDISNDKKVTPSEKQQVKTIWSEIKETDVGIVANADKYKVDLAKYSTAFTNLENYLENIVLKDLTTTTTIVRSTFDGLFEVYYARRADVNRDIVTQEIARADATQVSIDGVLSKVSFKYASSKEFADKNYTIEWSIATEVAKNQFVSEKAQQIAEKKGEVIYDNVAPPTEKQLEQNLWIDTLSGKNTPKRWNPLTNSWVVVSDTSVLDSIPKENLATYVEQSGAYATEFGTISGKIQTNQSLVNGVKESIEVVNSIGDANRLKHEIAKAELAEDLEAVEAQRTSLTNAIADYRNKLAVLKETRGKINSKEDPELYTLYSDQIANLEKTIADTVKTESELTKRYNALDARIKEMNRLKVTERDIKKQYFVKFDSESSDRISGFGLLEDSKATVDFAILADKFWIASPDNTRGRPFTVVTKPEMNPDGTVKVPKGVYIRDAFIANGSIDIAKIDKASVTSLSAISANIGHFKSAESGARLEIKDSVLEVYDEKGTMRVRLGVW